jgi:hypothetical protein
MAPWFETSPAATKISPRSFSTADCLAPGTVSMLNSVRFLMTAAAILGSIPAAMATIVIASSGFVIAYARLLVGVHNHLVEIGPSGEKGFRGIEETVAVELHIVVDNFRAPIGNARRQQRIEPRPGIDRAVLESSLAVRVLQILHLDAREIDPRLGQ